MKQNRIEKCTDSGMRHDDQYLLDKIFEIFMLDLMYKDMKLAGVKKCTCENRDL